MNTIENIQFDLVEFELIRRHQAGAVPAKLRSFPAMVCRAFCTAWWQLYQETSCIQQQRNRTVFERPVVLTSSMELDTTELVTYLQEIRDAISLEAILEYRALALHEESAYAGLQILIFYLSRSENHVLS